MVFVELVSWHARLWGLCGSLGVGHCLLFVDKLLPQTRDLGIALSQRLPPGSLYFSTGKQIPASDFLRNISGEQKGGLNTHSLAALQ